MVARILKAFGELGVKALKNDVQRVSATGSTAESIRYEVVSTDDKDTLFIYGRKFFSTLETGRGPRKSSTYGGFDESMYEYMIARGIGSDLPEKKRRQLARFLTLKINREGDKTYKQGGRKVYSATLDKLIADTKKEVQKDFTKFLITDIKKQFIKAA